MVTVPVWNSSGIYLVILRLCVPCTATFAVLIASSVVSCVIESESHSVIPDSATPWTVTHQAPVAMEFSRQECWSGLPFISPACVTGICKTPRPNLRVYLEFCLSLSFCLTLFWNHFFIYSQISQWYLKLLLMSNGRKEHTHTHTHTHTQNKTCLCLRVGHSQGKEKIPTLFLKLKASAQNSADRFMPRQNG